MVNPINSDQMIQQLSTMRSRGFGRRRGTSEDGSAPTFTRPEGAPPAFEGGVTASADRMQAFAAKYGRSLPEGLGSSTGRTFPQRGLAGFGSGKSFGSGEPQLSRPDGRQRPVREHNPQLAAAMEALKSVLDQSQELSADERQTQLVSWAKAYDMPVPEPGSKWFWEV